MAIIGRADSVSYSAVMVGPSSSPIVLEIALIRNASKIVVETSSRFIEPVQLRR